MPEPSRKRHDDPIRRAVLAQMEALRLTTNQVAILSRPHVSRNQVYMWLRGESRLSSEKACRVLAAVGLAIDFVPKSESDRPPQGE